MLLPVLVDNDVLLQEWLGYLLATALLMASAAVTIKACGVSYTRTSADGRKVLLQIAHLEGTAVSVPTSIACHRSHLHADRCCNFHEIISDSDIASDACTSHMTQ